ncbi:MAG: ExbD/TolR family protein [Fusobacteriaceae bacterium]
MRLNRVKRSETKEVVLNITPLVDVVFFLLIFLLISTTFIKTTDSGIKIDLPTSTIKDSKEIENIQVSITKEKQIIVTYKEGGSNKQTQVADLKELKISLSIFLEKNKKKSVIISADKNLDYGLIVQVMTISKEAGATALDIDTVAPAK